MSKAILYGRHSTDKQDLTHDVQHQMCMQYYDRELKAKGVAFGGWYYDPAVSSSIFMGERDVGRVVIASLQPGDHLVVAKISRSFRSLQDGTNTIAQLELRGVTIHAVDLPLDSRKASGRLVRNVNMVVDQYVREIASESQREIIAYRKSMGLPFSKGVPVGWLVVGEKPHRVFRVDYEERALCDRIAERYARGWTLERLAYWCSWQKEFPNKRVFSNRWMIRHCLHARAKGYPKIASYKVLRRMIRLGEI